MGGVGRRRVWVGGGCLGAHHKSVDFGPGLLLGLLGLGLEGLEARAQRLGALDAVLLRVEEGRVDVAAAGVHVVLLLLPVLELRAQRLRFRRLLRLTKPHFSSR